MTQSVPVAHGGLPPFPPVAESGRGHRRRTTSRSSVADAERRAQRAEQHSLLVETRLKTVNKVVARARDLLMIAYKSTTNYSDEELAAFEALLDSLSQVPPATDA